MSKIAIGREIVDLAPIFHALPERNYLMNALDLFDGVGVQNPKVVVTQLLDDNYSLFNIPQSRYSHQTTTLQRVRMVKNTLSRFLGLQGKMSLNL